MSHPVGMRLAPLVVVLLLQIVGCDRKPERPPNVVLIVVDTLRADHVGAYGGSTPTPAMDEVARRGVRFEQAFAHAPMTGPSHGSMFTGKLPRQHGLLINGRSLPPANDTMAEILQAKGYRTAAFVSLQVLEGRYGFARGFDTYDDTYEGGWWRIASHVNANMLPWLRENDREPFFLFAHYSDPHEPYLPPARYPRFRIQQGDRTVAELPADGITQSLELDLEAGDNVLTLVRVDDTPWPLKLNTFKAAKGVDVDFDRGFRGRHLPRGRSKGRITLTPEGDDRRTVRTLVAARPVLSPEDRRRFYAEEVAFVDEAIGELIATLDERGLSDRTLVMITSDHGEELGERAGAFGHVHNLYDELIAVPWVMALPGRIPPRTVVSEPVRHVDLMPTVLGLAGLESPRGIEGRSAWPPSSVGERLVFAETHRPQARADKWAVRFGRHKVIRNVSSKTREVYDLELSPDERQTVDELARERAAAVLRHAPAAPDEDHELTDREQEALRALGYAE
ncbi:MAG: sulfatase [Myxococcota bacterium]